MQPEYMTQKVNGESVKKVSTQMITKPWELTNSSKRN